jgi:hypothetical protein
MKEGSIHHVSSFAGANPTGTDINAKIVATIVVVPGIALEAVGLGFEKLGDAVRPAGMERTDKRCISGASRFGYSHWVTPKPVEYPPGYPR